MGGISGPCPQITAYAPKREMCPPSEDCASKKVTGSVPLDCSSGPETPKILFINPVFVSKNRFFADFTMKTFILFFGLHPKIRGISRIFYDEDLFLWSSLSNSREKSFCAPKKLHMPPSHATLAPGLQLLISYA